MNTYLKLLLLVSLSIFGLACSEDDDSDKGDKKMVQFTGFAGYVAKISPNSIDISSLETLNQSLQVVDEEQRPVKGARVVFGFNDKGQTNYEAETDELGRVSFPKSQTDALPVTIEAAGYTRTTYFEIEPGAQQLKITRADGSDQIEVSGKTIDYGRLRKDGFIDFSLVIPALSPRSMLNFEVSSVISPFSDKLSVAGKSFELPSNISLPKQQENYFIPLTFEKPVYRMFVRRPGYYKFFATHGRFPLKKVIDEMRGGSSVFDVINTFEFMGGGQKDLQVNDSLANQDISVKQLSFDQSISIQAPQFSAQYEMLSLALINQGGYYFPSDLKRLLSGRTTALQYPSSQSEMKVLSVLMNKDAVKTSDLPRKEQDNYDLHKLLLFGPDDILPSGQVQDAASLSALSMNFSKVDPNVPVSFLSFVKPPKIVNQLQLQLDTPTYQSNIAPKATFLVLSEIESLPSGRIKNEKRTRLWEVLIPGWASNLSLPNIGLQLDAKKQYRWEILYLGQSTVNPTQSDDILDGITHVSRNSISF